MRKKIPENEKRNHIIGIKVKYDTKKQLEFIAKRECETLSTTIDKVLKDYIENYFYIAKIDKNNLPEDSKQET